MTKPIAIQTINRNQVAPDSAAICAKQITAPSMGTRGTKGVRNGRGMSGRVFRSTITLIQTMVNASNVPIETNSPRILIGNTPARIIATAPHRMELM